MHPHIVFKGLNDKYNKAKEFTRKFKSLGNKEYTSKAQEAARKFKKARDAFPHKK